jgi:hypothetical protein
MRATVRVRAVAGAVRFGAGDGGVSSLGFQEKAEGAGHEALEHAAERDVAAGFSGGDTTRGFEGEDRVLDRDRDAENRATWLFQQEVPQRKRTAPARRAAR